MKCWLLIHVDNGPTVAVDSEEDGLELLLDLLVEDIECITWNAYLQPCPPPFDGFFELLDKDAVQDGFSSALDPQWHLHHALENIKYGEGEWYLTSVDKI